MRITLLPSSLGESADVSIQYLTSFLINDTLALDAGSLGFALTNDEQVRVNHILLSHSHIDHLASLPAFLETVFGQHPHPVTVYASQEVLDCLQKDMFNDRLWPDFLNLKVRGRPFVKTKVLTALKTITIEGLKITPVPVDHVVPTFGFLVEDAGATVAFSSDTCATEAIWQEANQRANLKAAFLEVSFPNALEQLATVSKHHTPASFGRETQKVNTAIPFLAYHLKPRYCPQLVSELQALGLPSMQVARPGTTYTF